MAINNTHEGMGVNTALANLIRVYKNLRNPSSNSILFRTTLFQPCALILVKDREVVGPIPFHINDNFCFAFQSAQLFYVIKYFIVVISQKQ